MVAVGLLLCGLWVAGFPKLKHDDTVQAATIFEMIKIALAAVAGVGGMVALVVAYRRQRVLEAGNIRSDREDLRSHTRLQEERFARASDEIASEKAAVQLAGVYAMTALADDWPAGRQRCIEVLCAYLRLPPKVTPASTEEKTVRLGTAVRVRRVKQVSDPQSLRESRENSEVRATIFRLIARHLRPDSEVSWAGVDLDFTRALIEQADFSDCHFLGGSVSFKEATFASGSMRFDRSKFAGSSITFSGASFDGYAVTFNDVEITGGIVSFGATKFERSRVVMSASTFSGGRLSFGDAQFYASSVTFADCQFGGDGEVFLGHTHFYGGSIIFQKSMFDGREIEINNTQLNDGELAFKSCGFAGNSGFRLSGSTIGQKGKVVLSKVLFQGKAASFAKTKVFGGRIDISSVAVKQGKISFGGARLLSGTVIIRDTSFEEAAELNLFFRYIGKLKFLTDWHSGFPAAAKFPRKRLFLVSSDAKPEMVELRDGSVATATVTAIGSESDGLAGTAMDDTPGP